MVNSLLNNEWVSEDDVKKQDQIEQREIINLVNVWLEILLIGDSSKSHQQPTTHILRSWSEKYSLIEK